MLKQPITDASAWTGADLRKDNSWIRNLSDDAANELIAAALDVKRAGYEFPNFNRSDFRIPELANTLSEIAEELENGRGFVLLRGLPIDQLDEEQLQIVFYGIGLNMGQPVRQNPKGDLLGLVMNIGDPDDSQTRVYETNRYLPFHTDPSDVVGLLCVRKAETGGLSSLVSTATVYNAIVEAITETSTPVAIYASTLSLVMSYASCLCPASKSKCWT